MVHQDRDFPKCVSFRGVPIQSIIALLVVGVFFYHLPAYSECNPALDSDQHAFCQMIDSLIDEDDAKVGQAGRAMNEPLVACDEKAFINTASYLTCLSASELLKARDCSKFESDSFNRMICDSLLGGLTAASCEDSIDADQSRLNQQEGAKTHPIIEGYVEESEYLSGDLGLDAATDTVEKNKRWKNADVVRSKACQYGAQVLAKHFRFLTKRNSYLTNSCRPSNSSLASPYRQTDAMDWETIRFQVENQDNEVESHSEKLFQELWDRLGVPYHRIWTVDEFRAYLSELVGAIEKNKLELLREVETTHQPIHINAGEVRRGVAFPSAVTVLPSGKIVIHFKSVHRKLKPSDFPAGFFSSVKQAFDYESGKLLADKVSRQGNTDPSEGNEFLEKLFGVPGIAAPAEVIHYRSWKQHHPKEDEEVVPNFAPQPVEKVMAIQPFYAHTVQSFMNHLVNGDFPELNREKEKIFLDLLRQIVTAVRGAQESSINHNDLKLDNIMVQYDGLKDGKLPEVKLIDFGSAYRIDQAKHLKEVAPLMHKSYLSPEAAREFRDRGVVYMRADGTDLAYSTGLNLAYLTQIFLDQPCTENQMKNDADKKPGNSQAMRLARHIAEIRSFDDIQKTYHFGAEIIGGRRESDGLPYILRNLLHPEPQKRLSIEKAEVLLRNLAKTSRRKIAKGSRRKLAKNSRRNLARNS